MLDPIPIAPVGGGAPFSNFSYALQWLTFGAVALVALVLFIRLELLQRSGKREKAGSLRDQLSGRDGFGDEPVPDDRADDSAPGTTRDAAAGSGPGSGSGSGSG